MGIAKVGGETCKQSRVRAVKVGAAKGWGGKRPRSFVLRTCIFGGMGVKKLHID